ncbi:transglutaminase TgpA family protein [Gilvimarinus sp. F26214L]|uniref:transglutaminase TgpA family protein n=1 Tax=Gilvimarinus sp. DZF01 TaxID=3461371 RepID=UPI0040465404
MIPHFQVPRNSLVWLLVAQTLLVIPHLVHLPVWILLAWLATMIWRVQIYRGQWPFPGGWIKSLIVALCLAGLLSEYRRFFGIEPMVGLLITAFLLKLLEMKQKRDALVVIFLGYFVAATQFLFWQGLWTTAYAVLSLIVLTTALLGLHQAQGHRYPLRSFGTAAKLLAQSVPLMVVLFIVMPRIGSIWAVPQQEHTAQSGVSDSMSPGDFSSLTQDDSRAFRVTFEGEIPPARDLYWRGLVLSEFDGRSWTQARFNAYDLQAVEWNRQYPADWRGLVRTEGPALKYEVILEATQQHWLYGLPLAETRDAEIGFTRDFRLVSRRPVRNRFQYQVTSRPQYSLAPETLAPEVRRRELALPRNTNPRARQLAREWRADAGSVDAYINRVLQHFNQEFTYTLEPPLLGEHPVDDFLWNSRAGFCEHFASAFTVMMRAAGIPARVVVGYQGGEVNPVKDFLLVRQADAHAWTEVWLEGRGWKRVDPTAAVAPDRIESGISSLTASERSQDGDNPFSLRNYGQYPVVLAIRLRLDALEYDWHRLVLSYDQDKQSGLLNDLLGGVTPLRVAGLLLGTGFVVVALIGLVFVIRDQRAPRDPGEKLYRRFLRRLGTQGIARRGDEGPRALAERVQQERPDLADWATEVTESFERYAYGDNVQELPRLRRLVRRPRKTLGFGSGSFTR